MSKLKKYAKNFMIAGLVVASSFSMVACSQNDNTQEQNEQEEVAKYILFEVNDSTVLVPASKAYLRESGNITIYPANGDPSFWVAGNFIVLDQRPPEETYDFEYGVNFSFVKENDMSY